MALNPIPILRIVQGVLAVLVLGLTAHVVTQYNKGPLPSPDEANFMIWNCVWTFLALLYLGLAPTYLPNLHHKYVVLAVEAVTVIFWFAGFVALAAYIDNPAITACTTAAKNDPICGTAKAAIAFGAFEWLAWCATLAFVIKALWNYRNSAEGTTGIVGVAGSNPYPMGSFEYGGSHQIQTSKPTYEGEPIGEPINVIEAHPGYQPVQYIHPEAPLQMPAPVAFGANDPTRAV